MIIICPKCRLRFFSDGKRYFCENSHSYDISRHGYVNLLPPSSHSHGDNCEMVRSRNDFLSSGVYSPLRDALCDFIAEQYNDRSGICYLDSGCGEGYYCEKISQLPFIDDVYGVDISTKALQYAHGRSGRIKLIASSVYDLPVANESVDMLTNVFSPFAGSEFARVLKKGGHYFSVIPGKYHLYELKKLVYDTPYENNVKPYDETFFDFSSRRCVDYEVTLTNQQAMTLWKMTPYYYRTPKTGLERIEKQDEITTRISFEILHYIKN